MSRASILFKALDACKKHGKSSIRCEKERTNAVHTATNTSYIILGFLDDGCQTHHITIEEVSRLDLQKASFRRIIMPTVAVSSATRVLWMMVVSTLMIMPTRTATSPPSLISPAPAPPSLPFHQLNNQAQIEKEHHKAQLSEIALEDYGLWNPTPYSRGGNVAPIPH